MQPRNILIVYHCGDHPPRPSLSEHLFSFARSGTGHRVGYLNTFFAGLPARLASAPFDLILFHHSFTAPWDRARYRQRLARVAALRHHPATKVAFFQDEFFATDLLQEFIIDFDIRSIYSVAPPSQWARIYPRIDPEKVRFRQVLTGYLDEGTQRRLAALVPGGDLAGSDDQRPIDLGYRVSWLFPDWLGRIGFQKVQIAQTFAKAAAAAGLRADIATDPAAIFRGDDWYRFLLRCRWTIGVESGSTLLDPDCAIRDAIAAFRTGHPRASFDEVERACFPGLDGNLALLALSPRHLEACLTRTAQALVAGGYNGVLRPHVHYLPVAPDFSDVGQVAAAMASEGLRRELVGNAWRDIVASGRYTYQRFAAGVLEESLGLPAGERRAGASPAPTPVPSAPVTPASPGELQRLFGFLRRRDRATWTAVAVYSRLFSPAAKAFWKRCLGLASDRTGG